MKRCVAVWLAALLLLGAAAPVLAETVLEKIKRTGVLTAGTRTASIPFAPTSTIGRWSAQSRATSFPVTQSVLARADEVIK